MKRTLVFFAVMLGLWANGRQATATLGEAAGTVAADRHSLSAVQRASTAYNGYSVQEIQSAATTVREFISPEGVVFAIAWNGLVHPDLSKLLGSYAGEYRQQLHQTPRKRGHRRLRVQTGQIVVETWGHMRDLRGRAYLPALVPSGVSIDEIR